MNSMRRGFTMVELLIVIAIIGILTTIGVMNFGKYQTNARDNERSNKVTIISEYLEKYYAENGEYPSCPGLTVTPDTVKATTLPGIDTNVLTTPQRPSGELNSIKCTDLTSMSQGDYFAYVGDGSKTCTTGTSCLEYTIKYKDESTNSIATINSRHQTDVKTSGNVGNLAATATGFTSINLTWNSIDNATSYTLQRASDINFSTNLVSTSVTGLSSSIAGLTYNTKYYFRVQPVASNSTGNWSNTIVESTWSLATPAGTATTNSTTQITESWGAVSHAASYQVQVDDNTAFSSPSTASTSGTSHAFTGLTPGKTWHFRVRAINGSYTGSWSGTDSATTTISAPNGTATTNSATQITESWGAVSGAASYYVQIDDNSSFSSPSTYSTTSTSKVFTSLTQGKTWYFRVYTHGANANSSWSGTDYATTTINAPATTIVTQSSTSTTTTFSWSAASCPSGTSAKYRYTYLIDNGFDSGDIETSSTSVSRTTSAEGYIYYAWVSAGCTSAVTSSEWGGTGATSYYRPVNNPGAISFWLTVDSGYVRLHISSSCTGGTYVDSTDDPWIGSGYIWSAGGAGGWWADSHGGIWLAGWGYYGTPYVQSIAGSYPSGTLFAIRAYSRCHNYTTGKMSGTTYGQSGQMATP